MGRSYTLRRWSASISCSAPSLDRAIIGERWWLGTQSSQIEAAMSRSLSRLQATLLALVVLTGVTLAGTGLFAIGKRHWLWSDTFHVHAGFQQIRGVEAGTCVRIQGIQAGEVDKIQPPAEPGGEVTLHLRLDGRLRGLVRKDATVQIVSEGMIGGKVVELSPGTAAADPVETNAKLASRPTAELTD